MATSNRLQRSRRTGITLVESLVSVTITVIAGTALFSAIGASLGASYSALNSNIGAGLADQLLEEMSAVRFPTSSDSRPTATGNRSQFNDLDDYHKWSSTPPENKTGYALGNEPLTVLSAYPIARPTLLKPDSDFLQRLTREVTVEKIRLNSSSEWEVTTSDTDYRRVTVTIKLAMQAGAPRQTIKETTRIFSYVPLSP